MHSSNEDPTGPFGTPDGSRAEIDDVLNGFVDLDEKPSFGAVATRASDASVRVIVGKMGAGKTVYMRRLHSFQEKHQDVYADHPQQSLPQTELIIRASQWFPRHLLVEKWMQIWHRAILRSLTTHLLASKDPHLRLSEEETAELRQYPDLVGEFNKPRSIYSAVRELINDHNNSHHFTQFLEKSAWDDLESTLAEILRGLPPIFFYLDAVDDTFNSAPLYWLKCQEGLFLQVMQLLRDAKFGARLHVVICIRDIVLSSIYQSEHAPRYHDEPHIRVLAWTRESIEYLLLEKLHRLPAKYKIAPDMRGPIESWLGTSWVHNESRHIDENLLDYMIRHTRLIPRDVVSMGNALAKAVLIERNRGRSEFPPDVLREVVARTARRFGDSQLAQSANQVVADLLPEHAAAHGYVESFIANEELARSIRDRLKEALRLVEFDRFDATTLTLLQDYADEQIGKGINLHATFWQSGLLGYVEKGRTHFYSVADMAELDVPLDAEEYVLHPCLLDSVRGLHSKGSVPVNPFEG